MYAATLGYRNDGDAGLTHVGARYYDAQVGRFISRDTELDEHPYLYCEHDPVNNLDPTGHAPPKKKGKVKKPVKANPNPYPFPWIKEVNIEINVNIGGELGVPGASVKGDKTKGITVKIDAKDFWIKTPEKDQNNLKGRPDTDYIQYIYDMENGIKIKF